MLELSSGSGVVVTGVEYVITCLLVFGAHELMPVAMIPVVEYFFCLELAVMVLLFQIY